MQKLPPAGSVVDVRGRRWRIVDRRPFDDCELVALDGAGADNVGERRQLLAPFDLFYEADGPRRLRLVTRRLWRRACRSLVADTAPAGSLATARHARIDILPHQLEPALAIVRGLASRVLLADEVGLGKTIQAGLIVCELRARAAADRTLILTPAGLREQWAAELRERFAIDASVVGAKEIRERLATLPPGVNPWSAIEVAVASFDYVKRPETLAAIDACRWDALVVDEAHNVAGDNDRHQAVARLAARASSVVLVTATPHSGDRRAFVSLCGLGARGDRLWVFRRTRRDVDVGAGRRVHRLQVQPSAAERRMHALVAAFSRTVCDDVKARGANREGAWLAVTVLTKRALSSARALALTVERRMTALGPDAAEDTAQLALPLADPDGETSDADRPVEFGGPALADIGRERDLLAAIAAAAHAASGCETKIAALVRLLRRVREPAVVFTEYRDTLHHVHAWLPGAAVLHGGLSREERASALAAFTSRSAPALIATDAAGEGLNLHHACRFIVNVELPWNPMRLEQRIGRVDRIGQRRRVHAIHLIGRGTGEIRIVDRLRERIAGAQADIGAADPLGFDEERAMAAAVVPSLAALAVPRAPASEHADVELARASIPAEAEAARLREAQRFTRRADAHARARLEATSPWMTYGRGRGRRVRPVLALLRLEYEDGCGRVVHTALVPLAVELERDPRTLDRATLLAIVETAWARTAIAIPPIDRAFAERRLEREQAIASTALRCADGLFQAGLFDRRAEHLRQAAHDAESADRMASQRRLMQLGRACDVRVRPARLLLIRVP